MLTFTMWPQAVNQTEIICEWHFHPDEVHKPGFDPKDAVEFWDITNKQDWELSDLAQRGISSKGYQPGPYSNREVLLLALDRFVLERVGDGTGLIGSMKDQMQIRGNIMSTGRKRNTE
jgi:Rieske 2Fe-2S family protein